MDTRRSFEFDRYPCDDWELLDEAPEALHFEQPEDSPFDITHGMENEDPSAVRPDERTRPAPDVLTHSAARFSPN